MHREMAANLVAQMNSEMRGMKMTADARWAALMDFVFLRHEESDSVGRGFVRAVAIEMSDALGDKRLEMPIIIRATW